MEEYIEALIGIHPENLKPEAKQLFDVIMRVIDERDEYKQRTIKAIEYLAKCNDNDVDTRFYSDKKPRKNILLEILKGSDN